MVCSHASLLFLCFEVPSHFAPRKVDIVFVCQDVHDHMQLPPLVLASNEASKHATSCLVSQLMKMRH